jgi:hypothetical protein
MRLTLGAIRLAPRNNTLVGGWPTARESAAGRRSERAYSSIDQLRLFEPEGIRYPSSVCRIRALAIGDVWLLHVQARVAYRTRRVLEEYLLLRRRHLPEQVSRLFPMIVVDAVVPVRCVAFERERRLGEIRLVVPEPHAVGVIGERLTQIAVGAHLAVAVVAVERALDELSGDFGNDYRRNRSAIAARFGQFAGN